jgi:hypothetical protein
MKQPITQLAVTAFTLALAAASGPVLAQQAQQGSGGGAEIIIEEQPARIQVEQGEPDVIVDQPAPDVQVTKPRPEVGVDQAAPDVKLRDAAPRVSVDEEGQPDVTVRQQEADVQVGTEGGQPQQEAERITREPEVGAREGQQPPPTIAGEEPVPEGEGPGWLMTRTAGELVDMTIVNRIGEEIGEVERVVREMGSDRLFAITSVGGFLGIGDTEIAIGLDEMNLRDDSLVAPVVAGEDRLEERYAYDPTRFNVVDEDVVLGQQPGITPGMDEAREPLPAFSILDADGDGYISETEAQASPVLRQAWPRIDADNNQRIDRGEFSAFEAGTPNP